MTARGRYRAVVTAARRKQILDAAAACFRRDGFRGASMADISKTAGISTGHIYHYFENKEAIVEAVVERGQSGGHVFLDQIKGLDDIVRAILKVSLEKVPIGDSPAEPVLLLESFAEASHNPMVAGILHGYDSLLQVNLREILKAGQVEGAVGRDIDTDEIGLLLKTVLYGFVVQMALLPDCDMAAFRRMLCSFATAFFRPVLRSPEGGGAPGRVDS